jgi:integrase
MSSIYKDKKGYTYYQRWTYYKSPSGKKIKVQVNLGMVNKTQTEQYQKQYDDYYDKIDLKFKKSGYVQPKLSLTEVVKRYNKYNKTRLSNQDITSTTCRFNTENMKLFTDWYCDEYGDKLIDKIKTSDILEFKRFRTNKKLSPNTISINLRSIRKFFNWCIDEKILKINPYDNRTITIPKYIPRKDEEIPLDRDWKILKNFITDSIFSDKGLTNTRRSWDWFNRNDWFKYIIYIMLKTGCRGGEIRKLKWEKDETDLPELKESFSYISNKRIMIKSKGKLGSVPITPDVKKVLDILFKQKDKTDVYVFQSPITNRPFDKSVFNKSFRKLMIGLGLKTKDGKPKYKPHSIRHGVVSHLLQNGRSIYSIQKLLRHSSIRTTMDIYGHLQESELNELMGDL